MLLLHIKARCSCEQPCRQNRLIARLVNTHCAPRHLKRQEDDVGGPVIVLCAGDKAGLYCWPVGWRGINENLVNTHHSGPPSSGIGQGGVRTGGPGPEACSPSAGGVRGGIRASGRGGGSGWVGWWEGTSAGHPLNPSLPHSEYGEAPVQAAGPVAPGRRDGQGTSTGGLGRSSGCDGREHAPRPPDSGGGGRGVGAGRPGDPRVGGPGRE